MKNIEYVQQLQKEIMREIKFPAPLLPDRMGQMNMYQAAYEMAFVQVGLYPYFVSQIVWDEGMG